MRIKKAYTQHIRNKQRRKKKVLPRFVYEFCSCGAADLLLLLLQRRKFRIESENNKSVTIMEENVFVNQTNSDIA